MGVSLSWDFLFNTYLDIRMQRISLILLVPAKYTLTKLEN